MSAVQNALDSSATVAGSELANHQHDKNEILQAVTFIQDLKNAIDLCNTDRIELSLIRWRRLTDSEKSLLPSYLKDFLSKINSLSANVKYSVAVRDTCARKVMNDAILQ